MEVQERLRENLARFEATMAEAAAYFGRQGDRPAADGEAWGGREVLAHLLFWHEQHCQLLEAVLAGQTPAPLARPLDELNAEAVTSGHGRPLRAMLDELLAMQPRLRHAFEALPDPNVMLRLRADGPALPAVDRAAFLSKHLADHLDGLRGAQGS